MAVIDSTMRDEGLRLRRGVAGRQGFFSPPIPLTPFLFPLAPACSAVETAEHAPVARPLPTLQAEGGCVDA